VQFLDYCIFNLLLYLVTDSHQPSISALSHLKVHNGQLLSCSNQCVRLSVFNSPAHLNICWTIADRACIDNLTSSLNPSGVSLFSLLLTPEIFSKSPSSSFIRIDMLIKLLMTNWQLCSNMLGALLLSNALNGGFKHIRINEPGLASNYGLHLSKSIGLLEWVPAVLFAPCNLCRNGGLSSAKIRGNLGAIQSFFHEAKNLISFSLAEVFIAHCDLTVQVKIDKC